MTKLAEEVTGDVWSEGAVTVKEACRFTGLGRTLLFELIESGELVSDKIDNRRLIPRKALIELGLPPLGDPKPFRNGSLSVRVACEQTALPASDIYSWMTQGVLPYKLVGRRRLIPKDFTEIVRKAKNQEKVHGRNGPKRRNVVRTPSAKA